MVWVLQTRSLGIVIGQAACCAAAVGGCGGVALRHTRVMLCCARVWVWVWARRCVHEDASKRPSASQVVALLGEAEERVRVAAKAGKDVTGSNRNASSFDSTRLRSLEEPSVGSFNSPPPPQQAAYARR